MSDRQKTVALDADLEARLGALASRSGQSVQDLAADILRTHAEEQELRATEEADDEVRWQRYLATGQSVSFDTVRGKLRRLASEAAVKADTQ